MVLIDYFFPKKKAELNVQQTFKMIDGYVPVFHDWNGAIYESEFVKTAIDAIARHISKLSVVIEGGTQSKLITDLKKAPNAYSTWSQFLYRIATILYVKNTAFIVPLRDKFGQTIGIYPICPVEWQLVTDDRGTLWVRFKFKERQTLAEKLNDIGILTRYQYESEFFGSSNKSLNETMNLISIQRQGIEESTKNATAYRFWANVTNFSKADDLAKERQRFDEENFQAKNGGGILLFPNTYRDVHQITNQSYTVDSEQLKLIERNIYDYFGVNEDIIQNKAYGDLFSAFYEGAIEPLAIQLSEVLTRMLFTSRQIAFTSGITFTANRIQYMSNTDKLAVSKDLVDRGVLSINEAREIWQLTPIDGGDRHILRGEYYDSSTGTKVEEIGDSTDDE
ncbi:MAG: phage portal protein [Bacteroidales bacterium]|nr:phage portal protein [Bacteroidales bacterium]